MEKTNRIFTQKEVNRIFSHIPPKTLRWWGMMDLYGHVAFALDARGTHRSYDLGNLYQIAIVEELSSLNISSDNIHRTMTKNFRYGMNMTGRMDMKSSECPLVDVVTLMNKFLIMSKVSHDTLFIKPDETGGRIYDWDSFIINKSEFSVEDLFKGSGVERSRFEGYTVTTIMVIDLGAIKVRVDLLLA
jgi:hypothetical protein